MNSVSWFFIVFALVAVRFQILCAAKHYEMESHVMGKRVAITVDFDEDSHLELVINFFEDKTVMTLYDYDSGYAAIRSDGECSVMKTDKSFEENEEEAAENNGTEIAVKSVKEFEFVQAPMEQHSVLRYLAGQAITDFCKGLKIMWLVPKDPAPSGGRYKRKSPKRKVIVKPDGTVVIIYY